MLMMLPKDDDRDDRGSFSFSASFLRLASLLMKNHTNMPRKIAAAIPPTTPPATRPAEGPLEELELPESLSPSSDPSAAAAVDEDLEPVSVAVAESEPEPEAVEEAVAEAVADAGCCDAEVTLTPMVSLLPVADDAAVVDDRGPLEVIGFAFWSVLRMQFSPLQL